MCDARTGTNVAGPFRGHTGYVKSVAFSPDGHRIASGSDDQTIRVWNARTGDTVAGPFSGHNAEVNSIAFSPDGKRIISGSVDKTIIIWNADSGEPDTKPLEGHTAIITSVAFSPDGNSCVSSSDDGTIRIWDITVSAYLVLPLARLQKVSIFLTIIICPAFTFRCFVFQSNFTGGEWMDHWP